MNILHNFLLFLSELEKSHLVMERMKKKKNNKNIYGLISGGGL